MIEKLYYDGQCPMCTREVRLLRKLSGPSLSFQDFHTVTDPTLPSRQELLLSLHLRRADGVMLRGLQANVAMWQHTPVGLPWRLLTLPGVSVLSHWCYERWAQRRFERFYGCATQCQR